MRKVILFAITLSTLMIASSCGEEEVTPNPSALTSVDANAFLTLINGIRSTGCNCKTYGGADQWMPPVAAVTWREELRTSAQMYAQFLIDNNVTGHFQDQYTTIPARILGYSGYSVSSAGENLYYVRTNTTQLYANETQTFNWWKNSTTGHCQVMMSPNITQVGLGRYAVEVDYDPTYTHRDYWTLHTARP